MRHLINSEIYFTVILYFILILEGTGIQNGRQITYYIILAAPIILYSLDTIQKKQFKIPKQIVPWLLIFFASSVLSMVFSLNLQNSFEQLLLYVAYVLVFIYCYNHKEKVSQVIPFVVIICGFFFILYSGLYKYLIGRSLLFSSSDGFQFVYSQYGSHNHLGDFLGITIIIMTSIIISPFHFFQKKKNKKSSIAIKGILLLLILVSIVYLFFSFSRSAYFGVFIIGIIILLKKNQLINKLLLSWILIALIGFFYVTVADFTSIPIFSTIHSRLAKEFNLDQKSFTGKRVSYLNQALLSIKERPLFGVGMGNFQYIAQKHMTSPKEFTTSSHNWIVDLFSENGVIAGLAFIVFLSYIFKKSRRNSLYLALLFVFINFQTDYTYKIYSFLLIFFVMGGVVVQDNEHVYKDRVLINTAKGIFYCLIFVALGNLFLVNNNISLSYIFYPLNQNIYPAMIDFHISRGDFNNAEIYISIYQRFSSGNSWAYRYIGQVYEKQNNKKKALEYYIKAYYKFPLGDVWLVQQIYDLGGNEDRTKEITKDFFNRLQNIRNYYDVKFEYRFEAMKLCERIYNLHCPYKL